MQFKTLENLSTAELAELFNRAFADYFVKIELSTEILQDKIDSEGILLNKSVGVFSNSKPIGFVLHAIRNKVAYNAGTGVIPKFRGNNYTSKMYDYILPLLKKEGVSDIVLEVIEQNTAAIKSYRKIGFGKEMNLECFKGKINALPKNTSITISEIRDLNFEQVLPYWNWKPTWQNSVETVQNSSSYKTFGAYLNKKLAGYIIANTNSGRVAQFAVNQKNRNQGIGRSLFQYLSETYEGEITVINVDSIHIETHSFLNNLGLNPFLTQHKMRLKLNTK